MDKDKFTGVTIPVWWLLDLQLGPEDLKEKRKALGKCWGWEEDGWFAQPERIGAVFDFLYPRHQVLLDELDSQVDDAYVRMKWIDDLIQARTSSAEQAATGAATTAENVAAAPAADQAMAKREDPPAPRRASAFGRPNTAEETPNEQPGEGRAPTGAHSAGTPAAEPRRPSPFARMAAATGPVVRTGAARAETAASAATGPAGVESVEQIKASLSELVADPSVPINQQEADALLEGPGLRQ